MSFLAFDRSALRIGAAAALLAGCGTLQSAFGSFGETSQNRTHRTSSYHVLYRFDRYPNGEEPVAGLTDVDGTLYGTASDGGKRGCHGVGGCGTFFGIATTGAESTLFTFSPEHGVYPESRLISVHGALYGTTFKGGTATRGTVYSIATSGAQTVLYSFAGSKSDGAHPVAGLTDLNGILYGTTVYGGMKDLALADVCCGTVYSVTTAGVEQVLHRFTAGSDGNYPEGGLVKIKGTLYGTTMFGGDGSGCACGTVYSITAEGVETVLYRFTGGSDGKWPLGNLIDVDGALYGTTNRGGGDGCLNGDGCGTVFSVTTSGAERVLYRFAGGSDGSNPTAGLIEVNGTLYGTTTSGGSSGCPYGCGTVYSISTSGEENVLYSFAGGTDGMSPRAPLLYVHGALYGTTALGGTPRPKPTDCCGTIFSLSP